MRCGQQQEESHPSRRAWDRPDPHPGVDQSRRSDEGAMGVVYRARDPQLAQLTTMQLLALSTLDPEKRDALQQRELF